MEPLITLIVPVYNSEKDLRRCLDSLTSQTYRNLEIILIDDGSKDSSGAICDEYAAKDSRIVCVHQPNSGVSKARNEGIKRAHGDYIHFPDSDDFLEPDTYEYLLGLMNEHQVDAVNFEYFVTYPSHETAHQLPDAYYGLFDTEGVHRIVLAGEPFAWNKLFKRKLIDGVTFRVDIFRGEDSLFAHQALDRTEKVWFDKRPLYHYVQSEESACRGKFRVNQLSAVKLYDAYEPLYKERYPDIWQRFLYGMPELLISLYYDMWADEENYTKEQKELKTVYDAHYPDAISYEKKSRKRQLKYWLFRYFPHCFCFIHKTIHKNAL